MWTALLQTIGSFAAAAIAWITLEFVGRPLRKFYDLRGETIYLLAKTANVSARWKQNPDGTVDPLAVSDEQISDLDEARRTLRDLASRFRAFAYNESYALKLARLRGYDPMAASDNLFGLSNSMHLYGPEKASHKTKIAEALRAETL